MSQGQFEFNIHKGPDIKVMLKYEVIPFIDNKVIAIYSIKQENFIDFTLTVKGN
jgi:hypothetical protein